MTSGHVALLASVAVLTALGVGSKSALLVTLPRSGPSAVESRAAKALAAGGWHFGEAVLPLTESGRHRLLGFRSVQCDGELWMSEVAANGEADGLLARLRAADSRLVYVQGGRVLERPPPTARAYLATKLAPLLRRLNLSEGRHDGVLAVILNGNCRADHLPWPAAE